MNLKHWEFIGIIFIVLLGTLLHFAYDYSNNNQFVALIAPVNESVWEHLKLGFYGILLFSLVEYIFVGPYKNFLFAKVFSAIIASALIVIIYFGVTTFMESNLVIDILNFVISITIAQIFSYLLIKSKFYLSGFNYIAIILLLAGVLVFASYTYNPPKTDLFLDKTTQTYGIK